MVGIFYIQREIYIKQYIHSTNNTDALEFEINLTNFKLKLFKENKIVIFVFIDLFRIKNLFNLQLQMINLK